MQEISMLKDKLLNEKAQVEEMTELAHKRMDPVSKQKELKSLVDTEVSNNVKSLMKDKVFKMFKDFADKKDKEDAEREKELEEKEME